MDRYFYVFAAYGAFTALVVVYTVVLAWRVRRLEAHVSAEEDSHESVH